MDRIISISVIALTFILFAVAIFVKGMTHDLLLEAGVFLVSAKIIISSYHMNQHQHQIERRFNELEAKIERMFVKVLDVKHIVAEEEKADS